MMLGMGRRQKASIRNVALALGVATAAAFGTGACSPEERTFEPTGAGGAGGAGGAMACVPDTEEPCYTGPEGTVDTGLCKAGTHVCLHDGSAFGECGGEVVPQLEDCLTPEDEACNGVVMDECPALGDGWLRSYGVTFAPEMVQDVATTPDGNLVAVGRFGGTIDFGDGPMASTGNYDIFIVKLDPLGKPIWTKRFGDASAQTASAVAVDGAGAIYVGGNINGSVDFGDGVKTSAGSSDAFLAKFDANGDVVWSKLFGDTAAQQINHIAVTKANQVVVAGDFSGAVSFNGVSTLTALGNVDVFVAKFDGSGFHAASRRFGGMGFESARGLALGPNDEVYVTGVFDTTMDFLPSLTSKGMNDVFVAELAANNLTPKWAKSFGDASEQQGHDVAVASNGDIFLSGAFEGTIDIGMGLQSPGGRQLYAARLTSDAAQFLWAKPFGDSTAIVTTAKLAVGTNDTLTIAGTAAGTIDFGGGPRSADNAPDPFMAKLTGDGAHVSSRFLLNAMSMADGTNAVFALTLLPGGDVVIGGNHRNSFEFKGMAVGETDPKDGNAFLGRFLP